MHELPMEKKEKRVHDELMFPLVQILSLILMRTIERVKNDV
jgi:hypothetical protein